MNPHLTVFMHAIEYVQIKCHHFSESNKGFYNRNTQCVRKKKECKTSLNFWRASSSSVIWSHLVDVEGNVEEVNFIFLSAVFLEKLHQYCALLLFFFLFHSFARRSHHVNFIIFTTRVLHFKLILSEVIVIHIFLGEDQLELRVFPERSCRDEDEHRAMKKKKVYVPYNNTQFRRNISLAVVINY